MINPFAVACPDCYAGAGERCRIRNLQMANPPDEDGTPQEGMGVHRNRRDAARLRVGVHGTCRLCGYLMVQMTDPEETRHPTVDLDGQPIPPCPPYPLPGEGIKTYRPSGAEQFVVSPVQPDPPKDQPMPPPPVHFDPLPATSDPMQDPPGSTV